MNYQTMFKTALLACAVGMMTACSNDGYDDETPYVSANFSNKLADGTKANLFLTYSGDSLIGKNVTFQTTDSKTANITLQNILPHETETTISGVALASDGNGGYSFSGTTTSPLNTTFSYKGVVKDNKMKLALSDIKIPGNEIGTLKLVQYADADEDEAPSTGGDTEEGTWQTMHSDLYCNTDNATIASLFTGLVSFYASPVLNLVLDGVTFSADGNITAGYAPLPDNFDFMKFIGDRTSFTHKPWQTSPKNLATYYMADDTTMYVTPNVDMIIRQIQMDKAKASRAGVADIPAISDVYKLLNKWTTTGLKLTLKPNPWKNEYRKELDSYGEVAFNKYEGDYILYISKDEIKPILTFLKSYLTNEKIQELVAKLPDDENSQMLKQMLPLVVPQLLSALDQAKVFELGIFLNKQTNE